MIEFITYKEVYKIKFNNIILRIASYEEYEE